MAVRIATDDTVATGPAAVNDGSQVFVVNERGIRFVDDQAGCPFRDAAKERRTADGNVWQPAPYQEADDFKQGCLAGILFCRGGEQHWAVGCQRFVLVQP